MTDKELIEHATQIAAEPWKHDGGVWPDLVRELAARLRELTTLPAEPWRENLRQDPMQTVIDDLDAKDRRIAELEARVTELEIIADVPRKILVQDNRTLMDERNAALARLAEAEQVNRELQAENSTLHNKQSYPLAEAEHRGEHRILDHLRRWRADPAAWDKGDENRVFRQIRYIIEAAEAREAAARARLAKAERLLKQAEPEIYDDYGRRNENTVLREAIHDFLR